VDELAAGASAGRIPLPLLMSVTTVSAASSPRSPIPGSETLAYQTPASQLSMASLSRPRTGRHDRSPDPVQPEQPAQPLSDHPSRARPRARRGGCCQRRRTRRPGRCLRRTRGRHAPPRSGGRQAPRRDPRQPADPPGSLPTPIASTPIAGYTYVYLDMFDFTPENFGNGRAWTLNGGTYTPLGGNGVMWATAQLPRARSWVTPSSRSHPRHHCHRHRVERLPHRVFRLGFGSRHLPDQLVGVRSDHRQRCTDGGVERAGDQGHLRWGRCEDRLPRRTRRLSPLTGTGPD